MDRARATAYGAGHTEGADLTYNRFVFAEARYPLSTETDGEALMAEVSRAVHDGGRWVHIATAGGGSVDVFAVASVPMSVECDPVPVPTAVPSIVTRRDEGTEFLDWDFLL